MYKKVFLLFPCFFLAACSLSSPTMTASAFERIPVGAPIIEIEAQVGSPYEVRTSSPEVQQYFYIERLETGPGVISQNNYILTVKDGKVVDKQRSSESSSLSFQFR